MSESQRRSIDRATRTLIHYEKLVGAYDEGEFNTAITDLLADLMLFCEHNEVDFDRCLSMATGHFAVEREK